MDCFSTSNGSSSQVPLKCSSCATHHPNQGTTLSSPAGGDNKKIINGVGLKLTLAVKIAFPSVYFVLAQCKYSLHQRFTDLFHHLQSCSQVKLSVHISICQIFLFFFWVYHSPLSQDLKCYLRKANDPLWEFLSELKCEVKEAQSNQILSTDNHNGAAYNDQNVRE